MPRTQCRGGWLARRGSRAMAGARPPACTQVPRASVPHLTAYRPLPSVTGPASTARTGRIGIMLAQRRIEPSEIGEDAGVVVKEPDMLIEHRDAILDTAHGAARRRERACRNPQKR